MKSSLVEGRYSREIEHRRPARQHGRYGRIRVLIASDLRPDGLPSEKANLTGSQSGLRQVVFVRHFTVLAR